MQSKNLNKEIMTTVKEKIARTTTELNGNEFAATLKVLEDAIVSKDGKYGLQFGDLEGAHDWPLEFDHIAVRTQGLFHYKVMKSEKIGMLSPLGEVYVPCEMDEICEEMNGVCLLQRDGKLGFFFVNEELYIAPAYDEVESLGLGESIHVRKGNVWGCFTQEGDFMTDQEAKDYEDIPLGCVDLL